MALHLSAMALLLSCVLPIVVTSVAAKAANVDNNGSAIATFSVTGAGAMTRLMHDRTRLSSC